MLSAATDLPEIHYVQTNLVSNVKGEALIWDKNLVNPWDVNFPQEPHKYPPVYVADQGKGVATAYQISSDGSTVMKKSKLAVTIPVVGSSEPAGPTGVVQNTHRSAFKFRLPDGNKSRATYIFGTLQGTIEAISKANPTNAQMVVDNSSKAEYTGLAAGTLNGNDYIYAANEGTSPGIQVFNSSFELVTQDDHILVNNPFIDSDLSTGFMPYGVHEISLGTSHQEADLFVTYRSPNFQGGAVAVFANDGTFLGQIASDTTEGGILQSPSGLAFIKGGFGVYSGDVLVGNFSSGQIAAYTVTLGTNTASGQFQGFVLAADNTPLTIRGLRTIHFGPGLGSGRPQAGLLFTAETDTQALGNLSLYGEITPIPTVSPYTGMHGDGYFGGFGGVHRRQ
jgi:uncharacterized protein (TIGR03118 family)